MDILYRTGEATATDVHQAMEDPPSYSAVRATLAVLERKGHVRHRRDGIRYVYAPAMSPDRARRSALEHLVETFFQGSAEGLVATLLEARHARLSRGELDRLGELIERARREERGARRDDSRAPRAASRSSER